MLTPAAAGFVAELRELHAACGSPTYRSLVQVSRRLGVLYPDYVRDRTLPPLSVTAISEVLAGRRAGLPRPEWVTVFVLACQRRGYETGVLTDDPGPPTLNEWITRLRKAKATVGVPVGGSRT